MKFLKELDSRMTDSELKPSDILVMTAMIFLAILVIFALIGSLIGAIFVLIFALYTSNLANLLMLIPCAIIFSISLAIALYAGINSGF